MSDPHKRKILRFQQNTANEQWNTNTRHASFIWNPVIKELLIAIKNKNDTTTYSLSWRDSSDLADWLHQQVRNARNVRVWITVTDNADMVAYAGSMLAYNQGWTEEDFKTYLRLCFQRNGIPGLQGRVTIHSYQVVHIEIQEDYVEDPHEYVLVFDEEGNEIPEIW